MNVELRRVMKPVSLLLVVVGLYAVVMVGAEKLALPDGPRHST